MFSIDLTGKVAIVTGSSQGLGKATATLLYQAGAKVVVNYFNDPEGKCRAQAEETVAPWGDRGLAIAADVRSRAELQQMFETIKARWGQVDILVNNAAILRDKTVKKMEDREWEDVIETNLSAVFRVIQTSLPFLNDGGRIVSLASISGIIGFFGQANYASAKAGVIGLTKVLSRELAGRKITVNAVAPGVIMTEMGKTIPEESRQQMLAQIPLRRCGEPDEIASVILFLCSDMASYMTGQTLHVNGGWWG